jgi:serine/threonine-protein kinase RsbW
VASIDEVLLTIPSKPEFASVARLTVAAMGSRAGLDLDAIEDLRLAIVELSYALAGGGTDHGAVEFRFAIADGQLEVFGRSTDDGVREAPYLNELSELMLAALVDSYQIGLDGTGHLSFELRRSRRPAGPGTR